MLAQYPVPTLDVFALTSLIGWSMVAVAVAGVVWLGQRLVEVIEPSGERGGGAADQRRGRQRMAGQQEQERTRVSQGSSHG